MRRCSLVTSRHRPTPRAHYYMHSLCALFSQLLVYPSNGIKIYFRFGEIALLASHCLDNISACLVLISPVDYNDHVYWYLPNIQCLLLVIAIPME